MSERSEYRRPPSDVDNMISLRVDNLPYRTHPEVQLCSLTSVSFSHYWLFLGPEASVWEVRGCGRYLYPQWKRNWEIKGLCLRSLLWQERRRGSYIEESHASQDQPASSCQNSFSAKTVSVPTYRDSRDQRPKLWPETVQLLIAIREFACWRCLSLSWVIVESVTTGPESVSFEMKRVLS